MDKRLATIKSVLGQPYYENEYGVIYNDDCMSALKQLSDAAFDCIITSPPYNIGKEYEEVVDTKEYIDWLSGILNEAIRLVVPNGSLLLNLGYLKIENIARAVPIPYLLWDKVNMFLQQEIVWNYGAGVACKNYLSPRNEKICWYVKDRANYTFNLDSIRDPNVLYPNQKKNGRLRCNTLGKNPSDVWQIAKVTSGEGRASVERTSHPAQFPEDLISRIIRGFTNKNDLVLDPFIGSGTVASVAMNEGRFFVGFEIDEDYCRLIAKRLEAKYLDIKSNLFVDLPEAVSF